MARQDPVDPLPSTPLQGVYRHYKGHLYEVIDVVRHSEELAPYVLYRCLDEKGAALDNTLWVRPHSMWSEPIVHLGETVLRFTPVNS
ncbi:MAG: DUF1653 domain-containing protein [Verrucomicrobia bacterium]|nr:DUF1653 domain-containing protein [Verrucomicrobiota bacterium]